MTPAHAPRPALRALLPIVVVGILIAGCGGTTTPSPAASGPPSTPVASEVPTDLPTEAPTEEPTAEPTEEPTEAPTEEPTAEPTEEPSETPSGEPSPTAGTAAVCTGNDDNRAFYAGLAEDVAWDVYCPVLPAGWFVETGHSWLSGGGRMDISYKGPGGRRIAIRQGAYCGNDADCPPGGADAGPASWGGRSARLVDLGDGSWIVVAEDGNIDWEATGTGMDGPTLAGLTARFAQVGE